MAAVKKSIWSNIIKTNLTEEKRYWNFRLRLFLTEVRLRCVWKSRNLEPEVEQETEMEPEPEPKK